MPNKILLVDDDREFRAEFKECLDRYDILEAVNGEDALRILKKPNEIDLVILDVKMPGPGGTEVLEEIKKIDPDLGIIMLTGHSSEDIAIEALKGRADDYLEKPADIKAITEAIERLLEKRSGAGDVAAMDIKGKMEKVKRFVERNCYKKISLEDAAQSVCLSPKYLSRIFKEQTRKTFGQFKLGIKNEKAKELLVSAGYNVNQISYKLGYENTESFIRQFKKHTDMTPTEYRKKARKKTADKKRKKSR